MRPESGVLAVFDDPGRATGAVKALHGAGFADVRAAMPAPFPDLAFALGPPSPLGWGVLGGGLLGVGLAFAMCIGTALAWPLMTGGKPIVSLPPYAVIGFETLIAAAAVMDVIEISLRLVAGRRRRPMPVDPRFSADRIGLFVPGPAGARAEAILRENGAEEVKHVG